MRLRRLLIRLITALAQGFGWLATLFRRLAGALAPAAETSGELETAETDEFVSAQPGPPAEWLAHVRRGPPADWLEKVSQGAPHLLDPQLNPTRPPAPPPPRHPMAGRASGHRPPSAADRVRPQPLKKVRIQPSRSALNQAAVVVAASPLAESSFSSPPPTTESAEATDEGPHLPGEGEILQADFPGFKEQSPPEHDSDWPALDDLSNTSSVVHSPDTAESSQIQTADPLPLLFPDQQSLTPPEKALIAEPHQFIRPSQKKSGLTRPPETPAEERRIHIKIEERPVRSPKSNLSLTRFLKRLAAAPLAQISHLITSQFSVGQDAILPDTDHLQNPRHDSVFDAVERPSPNTIASPRVETKSTPFTSQTDHRATMNATTASPSFKVRQPGVANKQEDFWPSLPVTAEPTIFPSVAPIDFPTTRQRHVDVKDNTQSDWQSMSGQKITAAYWPPLPAIFLDETAESEEEALDDRKRHLLLDYEQRGPEWNE